jgi:hypothetical protein
MRSNNKSNSQQSRLRMLNANSRRALASNALLTIVFFAGCITTTTKNGRQIPNEPSELSKEVHSIGERFSGFVAAVTPKDGAEPIVWDWATGLPQSVPKGEAEIVVSDAAVAAFVPSVNTNKIRLASCDGENPVKVYAINQQKVRTVDDLNLAVENACERSSDKYKEPIVELVGGLAGANPVPVKISPNDLIGLAHSCLPDASQTRVALDGNPWVLLRDDSVRCKTMLRKERRSNLVHLVMSLKVCWGDPKKLPVSLAVKCQGRPLSCLGVAEVLDRLYGDKKKSRNTNGTVSYGEIAEHDEFVTPVNYRALEAKLANDQHLANIRPYPAFATIGRYAYPGPPVLGDARALAAFALQPRMYAADDAEQTGWVVFDGSTIPSGKSYEVDIDLGSGPQSVRFNVPAVEM